MSILSVIVYNLTILPRLKNLKRLLPEAQIYPTGSRYVCDPPVMNTDIDFGVYSTDKTIKERIIKLGYKDTTNNEPAYHFQNEGYEFTAFRKRSVNLILTHSKKFIDRHMVATHICKRKNVRDKLNRVFIHEAVRGTYNTGYIENVDFSSNQELDTETRELLMKFTSPYSEALIQVYKAQYGL